MESEQQPMQQGPPGVQCSEPLPYAQHTQHGLPPENVGQNAQQGQVQCAQQGQVQYAQQGQVQYAQQGQVQYAQPGQVQYAQPSQVPYAQPGQVLNAIPSQVQYAQPSQVQYAQPGQVLNDIPSQVQYDQSGQVPYAQPGPSGVVIVNQPVVQLNYSIPRGRYPGVFMLLAALMNFIGLIVFVVLYGAFDVWNMVGMGAGVIWYFIVGVLAVVGAANKKRNTKGVAVSIVVTGTLGLSVPLFQSVIGGFGLWTIKILAGCWLCGRAHGFWSQPISIILLCVMIIAGLSFFVIILLIVLASQVACKCCCRNTSQPSGTAHYQVPQPGQDPHHQAPLYGWNVNPVLQPERSPRMLRPGAPQSEAIAPDEPSTMP